MDLKKEFRSAILETCFKSRQKGDHIIRSEQTGSTAPWLFDFRALMLQGKWLDRYAEIFWERYGSQYPFQVGGMETASIALVSAVVLKGVQRGNPVNGFFIRKSRKREGLLKTVEGTLTDDPVILVDDLLNSGKTFNKQVEIMREADKKVLALFAILAFRPKSAYGFATKNNIEVDSIFELPDFELPYETDTPAGVPAESFEVLWKYQAPDPSRHLVVQKPTPLFDGKRVYFGCDDGFFRALDADTGRVVWQHKVGNHPAGKAILSSPVLYKDRVYFGAYDGTLYSLKTNTGEAEWRFAEADWIGSSPSLAPDIDSIFIGLEYGLFRKRGGIAAVSLSSGKRIWERSMPELTHASPLYIQEEGMVVIGSNDGVVYAYRAKTGEPLWKYQTKGDIKAYATYDAKRRTILTASMDGTLYEIDAKNGTPLRGFSTTAGIYGSPLIHGNIAYVASLDKSVYAIDLATFKECWSYETNGRIFASPVIAEGSVWIGSNDGRLYELDPETGTLKHFFQATERIVNAIAYDAEKKRFFISTQANEIYCIRRHVSG